MSTVIRPNVSERNPYWISKHRYYELKHFCLQYHEWFKAYKALDGAPRHTEHLDTRGSGTAKPTEDAGIKRAYYSNRIRMVQETAHLASPEFYDQLLLSVTEGLSYEHIRARTNLPCSKDDWYELYRKFFWLLDQARG